MSTLLSHSLNYYETIGNPTRLAGHEGFHDRVYAFWKSFWISVLKQNETSHTPNPDNFYRQDYIGVFMHGDRIIAMHSHSFFDLRFLASREHSYFTDFFTHEYLASLVANGVHRVISMEMYSVDPEWRSSKLGVSLAAVMMGLGLKLAAESQVDGAVGIARMDLGVDRLVEKQGAVPLGSERMIYNTLCRQIFFHSKAIRPHPDEKVRSLTDFFWSNRIQATSGPIQARRTG